MEKAEKYIVIRDTREQEDCGWQFEENELCAGTERNMLKTGDYSLKGYEAIFIVERKKSTAEFAHNVCEKRFEDELGRLNTIENAFVVCEFEFADLVLFPMNSSIPRHKWLNLKLTSQFLIKRLNDLQLKYPNIKFIFAGRFAQVFMEDLFKRIYYKYKYAKN